MKLPGWIWFTLPLFGALACAKRDAHVVHSATLMDYNQWVSDAFSTLTPEVRSRISETEKEIKLGIMLNHEASGTEGVKEAYLKKINGLKVEEFFALGITSKIERLEAEFKQYSDTVAHQEKLKTKPGDYDSAEFLRRQLDENSAHVANLKVQLESARNDLLAVQKK